MTTKREICGLFGELLARRRSEAKMSQRAFAKAIGLSRTSVTNIERGRQPVSLPTLYVMADILRTDVCKLLPSVKAPVLLDEMRQLTAKQRNQLRSLTPQESDWLSNIEKGKQRKGINARN